jgi:predicted metal-dependent hydrolase
MSEWLKLRRVGFAIVNGYTERGLSHSTVWFGGALAHDPHPSKNPLINVVDMIVIAHRDPRASERDHLTETCGLISNAAAVREQHSNRVDRLLGRIETLEEAKRALETAIGYGPLDWPAMIAMVRIWGRERPDDVEARVKLEQALAELARLRARVEADDVEREALACAVEALGSEWSPSPGSEVAVGWSKILRDQLHKAATMIRSGKAQP